MADLTGPAWMGCLGEHIERYREDVEEMEDDLLVDESMRIEIDQPPTNPDYNDRDWRTFRRLVRQELHKRGIKGYELKT